MLRGCFAAAICMLLPALARSAPERLVSWNAVAMLAIAAAYLAALAWSGHSAAGEGSDGDVEVLADVAHLLAAGAWLGALPVLAFVLPRVRTLAEAARVTRRFSTLGAVCVAVLLASGGVNAWYLVGDVPALIGTGYGQLLLAKLALFAAMLILAMTNRWYLSVRLADDDEQARRQIRRNAIAEIAAGMGILAIVGMLGVIPPAVHETPTWPFAHTLSWERANQSAWLQMGLAAAGLMACVSVGVTLAGLRHRRFRQWLGGLVGIALPAATIAWVLAVPAYPSTYWSSPLSYTTDAIYKGSVLYAANCHDCHGLHRLDDAPPGRPQPMTPAQSLDHALRHTDGEHYWWIAHGIPGTSMPAFAPRLADTEIWDLIEFLHAQVEAQDATAMTERIKPLRDIVAPDFTFESAGRPQESLRQLRGNHVVLLVLYTLPESLPRLRELATDAPAYAVARARVIAAPFHSPSTAAVALPGDIGNEIASAGATVAKAYAMFARQSPDAASEPAHVEFLIDRQGYLRVRWIGMAEAGARRSTATLARIDSLNREPQGPPAPWGHRHR